MTDYVFRKYQITVPDRVMKRRYYRAKVTHNDEGDSHVEGAKYTGENVSGEYNPSGLLSLGLDSPQYSYLPASRCIYCGAKYYLPGESTRKLTKEHIISEGLGARLVLPSASCKRCADRTSAIESRVLKEITISRVALQIRRKSSAARQSDLFLKTIIDGREGLTVVPNDNVVSTLVLPSFKPPRLFTRRDTNLPDLNGFFSQSFGDGKALLGVGNQSLSNRMDVLQFSQLLAKIGHSYAHAALSSRPFISYLDKFIIRKFRDKDNYREHYEFVGGARGLPGESRALHDLALSVMQLGRKQIIVVYIRLFAFSRSPAYEVVVGELL